MELHPLRGAVLAEVHARPFLPIPSPRRLLHFAFMTGAEAAMADRARLHAFCRDRASEGPPEQAKHHRVVLGDAELRWEQHSEFTTYTWDVGGLDRLPFEQPPGPLVGPMRQIEQPGPLLVACDLHLFPDAPDIGLERIFDAASLSASEVDGGGAVVATDFRPGSEGFVRILVLDRGLTPARSGALVQRVLEIETYRTLALLGLPEAQRLSPHVTRIEDALTRIARDMTESAGLATDSRLLDELTNLAAALEAEATVSGFRFSASRAYDGIVQQRLAAIGEASLGGYPTMTAFLQRRMAPAMRTCQMLEERLSKLSTKLARAANLLRTRVDIQIERQNGELLAAMNERTRLQLRLQQTVEGLSVAAISYYIVSLLEHLFEGVREAGHPIHPGVWTAASIPAVVLLVLLVVRRIRRQHVDTDGPSASRTSA